VDGAVLPANPEDLYEQGRYNATPILIGTNSDEGTVFVQSVNLATYQARIRAAYGPWAEKILAAYPATDDASALRQGRDVFRDVAFAGPTRTWARLSARGGRDPVYLYQFDHAPPWPSVPVFAGWGAVHGSEIAFVFRNMDPGSFFQWRDEDKALSEMMSTYWVNFARTGDPNGPGLPKWPAFTQSAPVQMQLDVKPAAGPVANEARLRLLEGYYEWRRTDDPKVFASGAAGAKTKTTD
jgi:para-nitrobenzyl esterase